MKANEFKFKVTNSDGISAILTLDDLLGYEGEECGIFIKSWGGNIDHIPKELRGEAINYNSGYGMKGVNTALEFEYIHEPIILKTDIKLPSKIIKTILNEKR